MKASELEETVLQSIKKQVSVFSGLDLNSDKFRLSTLEQAEQEKKLLSLKDSKRLLYEQYIRKEITMEEYQAEKTELDYYLEMVESILAGMRKSTDELVAKYDEEARLKKLAQAASTSEDLNQELAERTVSKVHVFHDNRIEIETTLQDAFADRNGE